LQQEVHFTSFNIHSTSMSSISEDGHFIVKK